MITRICIVRHVSFFVDLFFNTYLAHNEVVCPEFVFLLIFSRV